MNQTEIYLAALLHDTGKLLERGNYYHKKKRKHTHADYFARLLEEMKKEKCQFSHLLTNRLIQGVRFHHNPENNHQKILQLAHLLSSSSGEEEYERKQLPLQSIFTGLFSPKNGYAHPLKSLNLEDIFPEKQQMEINYELYTEEFLEELRSIADEVQLYYLLEKYLWSVPHQNTKTDVSLFDHQKATAAIALCLIIQYEGGYLAQSELDKREESNKDQFLLIHGDLSGIQEFIFTLPTKGAAKNLKGRSVYLELLLDTTAYDLLQKLGLRESNLLYIGGGNFYLLAPKSCEEIFYRARKSILMKLLKAHQGDLYLAMAAVSFAPNAIKDFAHLWQKSSEEVGHLKRRMWSEIDLEDNYSLLFGPLDEGAPNDGHCKVCGVASTNRPLQEIDQDNKITRQCSLCSSFRDLTEELSGAKYMVVQETSREESFHDYRNILSQFGREIMFTEDRIEGRIYKLNTTSFLEEGCTGFLFGAFNLPKHSGKQLTFEELAKKSLTGERGYKQLATLKLDVDNLGNVFIEGFGRDSSISKITALSRMLKFFFYGYINQVIKENKWADKIYTVFSGGDDTYMIGTWDVILDFAYEFYKKFRDFTCNQLTFSAGILVHRFNHPVFRMAEMAENALDSAKNYKLYGEERPQKNRISLFGEVFQWAEFEKIQEIKDIFVEMIVHGQEDRSLLYKVYQSTSGFKKVLELPQKQLFDDIHFWRFVYHMRNIKNKKKAEELIQIYQRIVIQNLTGTSDDEDINNIMIIPVAVRLAELTTRKIRE